MHLVHFVKQLVVKNKGKSLKVTSTPKSTSLNLEFTYNFSNNDQPNDMQVNVQKLSDSNKQIIKKGATASLTAGFYDETYTHSIVANVTTGTVSFDDNDSDDPNSFSFHIKDGANTDMINKIKIKQSKQVRGSAHVGLAVKNKNNRIDKINKNDKRWKKANPHPSVKKLRTHQKSIRSQTRRANTLGKKRVAIQRKRKSKLMKERKKIVYKAMSFKKNTKGLQIIKSLAKKAGIRISKIKLEYNRVYRNGYTANKKPMQCIRDVASTCKTPVFYRHGKLYIEKFVKNRKLNLYIQSETGLLKTPTLNNDDDKNTWNVQFLFRSVTTGDVFHLKSKTLNGWVIIVNGDAECNQGSAPVVNANVMLYKNYTNQQASSINAARKSDKKKLKKSLSKRKKRRR